MVAFALSVAGLNFTPYDQPGFDIELRGNGAFILETDEDKD
jgi:hypothetical protein